MFTTHQNCLGKNGLFFHHGQRHPRSINSSTFCSLVMCHVFSSPILSGLILHSDFGKFNQKTDADNNQPPKKKIKVRYPHVNKARIPFGTDGGEIVSGSGFACDTGVAGSSVLTASRVGSVTVETTIVDV